jgi:hypothetical protein
LAGAAGFSSSELLSLSLLSAFTGAALPFAAGFAAAFAGAALAGAAFAAGFATTGSSSELLSLSLDDSTGLATTWNASATTQRQLSA